MANPLTILSVLTLGVAATLSCRAQLTAPAPTTLPACIIRYETRDITYSGFPRWYTTFRTMIYHADGTYAEWPVFYAGPAREEPPPGAQTGTFTYKVDPQNSAHATIIYDGGSGPLPADELYFTKATSGYIFPLPPSDPPLIPGDASFAYYPEQSSTGGINLSTRATLTSGGHAIVGFVISGSTPRWVLLRAVGPSLQQFGVSATATSPSFTLWNSQNQQIGASAVWSADPSLASGFSSASALVGAFPLATGSDEGMLLQPLPPGAYTMVLSAKSAGDILGEVYILPF